MTPGSIRRFETERAFASAFPAQEDAARDLWEALSSEDVVIAKTDAYAERDICGMSYGDNRPTGGVIAEYVTDTGEGGAYLLQQGASIWEVYELIQKQHRMEDRLQRARFGELNEDPDELQRVVDVLQERVEARSDLETSFDEGWLPREATEQLYARRIVRNQQLTDQDSHFQTGLQEASDQ